MEPEKNMEALKKKLGFSWHDEGLLRLALTHGSFVYESKNARAVQDNQRLEFLGDAVLELVVSAYLYCLFPSYSEGELTRLRASLVCERSLVKVAGELSIGGCLLMGRGEEHSGGRERPSILADAVESLLGAIYLDQGLEQAEKFILFHLRPILGEVMEGKLPRDYKTELQELLQRKTSDPVNYVIVDEKGPDHEKTFTAAVIYLGKEISRGSGRTKKEAEQQAACIALEMMNPNRQKP